MKGYSHIERFRRIKYHLTLFIAGDKLLQTIDKEVGTDSQVIYRWLFWYGFKCIEGKGSFDTFRPFGYLKEEMDKNTRREILGMLVKIAERNERRGNIDGAQLILDQIHLSVVDEELTELNGSVSGVILFRDEQTSEPVQESVNHLRMVAEKLSELRDLVDQVERTTEDAQMIYSNLKRTTEDVRVIHLQLRDYHARITLLEKEVREIEDKSNRESGMVC